MGGPWSISIRCALCGYASFADRADTCGADGNKNDRMLVRYSSVRYSHRLGYAQLSQVACGPGESSGAPEPRRLLDSSVQQPSLVHSSLEVSGKQLSFVPKPLLMGGTSEARCKPSRSEGEAQELGDDDSCLVQYSESCRTPETGIEAVPGEQGLW